MHRTNPVPRSAFGFIVLSLVVGQIPAGGKAAAQGLTGSLQTPARLVAAPSAGMLLGQEPAPAPKPLPAVAVPAGNQIVLPVRATKTLQMRDKQPIRSAVNEREDIANVQAHPSDNRSVIITALQPGVTRLTLTGQDGNSEVYELTVQLDIEYLRTLLPQAVPTANVQLVAAPGLGGLPNIIVTGTVRQAEDVQTILRIIGSVVDPQRIINAMHIGGVQQVQLDVVVAVVSRSEIRRMNFDFLNQGNNHVIMSSQGGAITNGGFTQNPGSPLIFNNLFGQPNGTPSNIFVALFNDQQQLFTFLQLLRTENLAKLLAEPRLVTMSGRVATFLAGGQQAVPSPGGLGAVNVQFIPFGTQLNFLPIVLGNGKIYLEVAPAISQLDPAAGVTISGFSVQGRITQQVHTTVEMEDGQTFVIGGLIENRVLATTTKVPVLGDLPFIGAAFSSKTFTETEQEVVILVTPHLVDPLSCDQRPKYLPGQETRSPDDFELFLEGILEAPRGPRVISPNRKYKPAWQNGPSANREPCSPSRVTGDCNVGTAGSVCGKDGKGLADSNCVGYSESISVKGKEKPAITVTSSRTVEPIVPVKAPEDGSAPTMGVLTIPSGDGSLSVPASGGPGAPKQK